MRKKYLAIAIGLAMAASLFVGCSKKIAPVATTTEKTVATVATTTKAEPSSSAGAIGGKLTIWEHSSQFEEPLKAVIAGFNKQYPDVKMEYQIKTSDQYYNLLQTAMQAGEAPDLFWTNGTATTNLAAYAKQKLVMDLTGKVDLSLYDGTNALSLILVDGKQYAVPTAEVGGRAVFYNKDIFKKLGLEIPKTLSEFEKDLKIIKDNGYLPISFSASDPWAVLFHFEPVLAATSLDWLQEFIDTGKAKVNDSRVVAAYQKMLDWGAAGYYGPGYTGVTEGGALLAFSKGEAAMCIEGTWNIQTIQKNNPDLNFGAFQLPGEDGVRPFVGTSSVGYSISTNTKNVDASLAFVNYFSSLEGQTIWLDMLDSIPCTQKIKSKNEVINDIAQFDVQTESFYSILGYLEGDGESPRNIWEEDQTKIFTGGLTVQEFTDELQELCK
jgi:raffinose/stachyose/melibiose transport system substrate-binding protein